MEMSHSVELVARMLRLEGAISHSRLRGLAYSEAGFAACWASFLTARVMKRVR